MKLVDLWRVNGVEREHRQLVADRRLIASGKGLGVTIQSKYQDEALIEAVRASVVAELDRRIAEAEAELVALGVQLPLEGSTPVS